MADARGLATESASALGRAPVSWPPVPPPPAASVENSESLPDLSHFSLMGKKAQVLAHCLSPQQGCSESPVIYCGYGSRISVYSESQIATNSKYFHCMCPSNFDAPRSGFWMQTE